MAEKITPPRPGRVDMVTAAEYLQDRAGRLMAHADTATLLGEPYDTEVDELVGDARSLRGVSAWLLLGEHGGSS